MIEPIALRSLFLDASRSDQPISYFKFKSAGMSDAEYLEYCNLCEEIRCAAILYCRHRFHGLLEKKYAEIVEATTTNLKTFLEGVMDTSFDLNISPMELTSSNVIHYAYDLVTPTDDNCLVSMIYTSSEDYRSWIEVLIKNRFLLEKKLCWVIGEDERRKPSKKEKRESCEFYFRSKCRLNGDPCNKDYCSDYLKDGGLPIKRIPVGRDTVDFGDTVYVISNNGQSVSITISDYRDQCEMKPIEKALIHQKIKSTVVAGSTQYTVQSIDKAFSSPRRSHRPVCLLSEWQKAEKKLNDLEFESMCLSMPERPKDLGDSAALLKWAKDAGRCIERTEELECEIEKYESLLGIDDFDK